MKRFANLLNYASKYYKLGMTVFAVILLVLSAISILSAIFLTHDQIPLQILIFITPSIIILINLYGFSKKTGRD